MVAYVIAGLATAIVSIDRVSEVVNFTWFVPAHAQFFIYGFFAMTMFGAIYYIVPRLVGLEFCSPKMVSAHFWLAMLGILICAVPLAIGGVREGMALNTRNVAFLAASRSILPFLRASTTGDLLMALGHLIFLLNLVGLLIRLGRTSLSTMMAENVKPVGVTS